MSQKLNKHPYIRINCTEYILLLLLHYLHPDFNSASKRPPIQSDLFEKYQVDITDYLKQIINDPNPYVRKRARYLIVVFANMHPEGANQLISDLEARDQKALYDQYLAMDLDPFEVETFAV